MLFWWCPVTRQEAQTETWEVPYGNQEMLFWLWRWLSTGTRCPEQLWNLPPLRYSKAVWTWSWATGSRCLSLSGGVGPDELQRSLPTSTSPWFWALKLLTILRWEKVYWNTPLLRSSEIISSYIYYWNVADMESTTNVKKHHSFKRMIK